MHDSAVKSPLYHDVLATMSREDARPLAGEQVVLLALPPGLLDELPEENQRAIIAMVGKSVTLTGYDEDGRAALSFVPPLHHFPDGRQRHATIWVAPECIGPIRA